MTRPWTLEGLAAAADEPEDRICRYAAAGLLHRHADGAFAADSLQRLRLIHYARSHGFGDEQLLAASTAHGDLLAAFPQQPLLDSAAQDLRRIAAELDIPGPLVDELARIVDWDLQCGNDSDVAALGVIAEALHNGFPEDALLQLVRVFADTTERLADAAIRTFHDYVHDHLRAQGLTGPARHAAGERLATPTRRLLEETPLYLYRRAYRRAAQEELLRHLRDEPTPQSGVPGKEHSTVLFVDLAGFTPLAATMGDLAAAEVLGIFGTTVRDNATRHSGRIVKQIGDAFMMTFTRAASAVEFGLAINGFVDTAPQFPALHIGAHYGAVLYRDGDYLGSTVNLAARVASAGIPGQFLVTEQLHREAGELLNAEFILLPPRRLKGISDPIRLLEVRDRGRAHPDRVTDPVCGMRMRTPDVAYRVNWGNSTYAFCSDICRAAFEEAPERFIPPPPQ